MAPNFPEIDYNDRDTIQCVSLTSDIFPCHVTVNLHAAIFSPAFCAPAVAFIAKGGSGGYYGPNGRISGSGYHSNTYSTPMTPEDQLRCWIGGICTSTAGLFLIVMMGVIYNAAPNSLHHNTLYLQAGETRLVRLPASDWYASDQTLLEQVRSVHCVDVYQYTSPPTLGPSTIIQQPIIPHPIVIKGGLDWWWEGYTMNIGSMATSSWACENQGMVNFCFTTTEDQFRTWESRAKEPVSPVDELETDGVCVESVHHRNESATIYRYLQTDQNAEPHWILSSIDVGEPRFNSKSSEYDRDPWTSPTVFCNLSVTINYTLYNVDPSYLRCRISSNQSCLVEASSSDGAWIVLVAPRVPDINNEYTSEDEFRVEVDQYTVTLNQLLRPRATPQHLLSIFGIVFSILVVLSIAGWVLPYRKYLPKPLTPTTTIHTNSSLTIVAVVPPMNGTVVLTPSTVTTVSNVASCTSPSEGPTVISPASTNLSVPSAPSIGASHASTILIVPSALSKVSPSAPTTCIVPITSPSSAVEMTTTTPA